jgi:phage shock protein C
MRKLYRSSRDRKLFGVCGGLAEYLAVDATLLRILLIVVAVFSAGSVILVYIIAGFVIPREPLYGNGFGANPFDQGWKGPEQPQYGTQGWNPGSTNWPGSGASHSSASTPRSGPAATTPPTAGRSPQGLDAMMEDIEKKAMQREIEELKARINKFEKDSKGE